MASAYVQVKYKYRKIGSTGWTSTGWAGNVQHESESLVMQKLREKHNGCEVQLVEIKWK